MEHDLITGVRFLVSFSMFAMVLLLAFVYGGRVQSRVYNRSRLLLMIACIAVGSQTMIQFFFHLREQSPTLCWAFNQTFHIPAILCFNLAETNLLRAGHDMKRVSLWFLFCLLVSYSLLLSGYLTDTLVNDAQPWMTMTCVVAALFFLVKIGLAIFLQGNMKRAFSVLSDEELHERHRALQYTAHSMRWLIWVSMIAPWIGVSSSLVLSSLYGLLIMGLMFWFLYRFIRYGDNMAEVIQVADEIGEASLPQNDPQTEISDAVHHAVQQWVAQRRYLESDLTIGIASKQMGISSIALNHYIATHTPFANYRQWVPYLRVEEGKRLMKEHPEYSQDAIAQACGYASQSVFSRAFKSVTGVAPTEWEE